MLTDMLVFTIGKFHNIITQFCHLFHKSRDEQQAETMNTRKQKTYEQRGASEYVHANHDHICKMEIDILWQAVGGLCAKTIPENIPALFHAKGDPVI